MVKVGRLHEKAWPRCKTSSPVATGSGEGPRRLGPKREGN